LKNDKSVRYFFLSELEAVHESRLHKKRKKKKIKGRSGVDMEEETPSLTSESQPSEAARRGREEKKTATTTKKPIPKVKDRQFRE